MVKTLVLMVLFAGCGAPPEFSEDAGQPDAAVSVDVDVWPEAPPMCRAAYRQWMEWGQYYGYADRCTLDEVLLWMKEKECTHKECEETEYMAWRAIQDRAPTTWGYCFHRCCPFLVGGPC